MRCKTIDQIRDFKPAPIGESVEITYRLKRDKHGNSIYEAVGEQNIQEYINSFKNGCSLKAILERTQYMPVREKVGYLQQTDNGFSADVASMPKDGTEAYIMLNRLKKEHPELVKRIGEGMSFDQAMKAVYGRNEPLKEEETLKGDKLEDGKN